MERGLVVPTPHLPDCQTAFLGSCQYLRSRLFLGGLQYMSRKVTEDAGEIDALSMLTTPAGFPRTCNGKLAKGAGVGREAA